MFCKVIGEGGKSPVAFLIRNVKYFQCLMLEITEIQHMSLKLFCLKSFDELFRDTDKDSNMT